jgi:hypothetical protein
LFDKPFVPFHIVIICFSLISTKTEAVCCFLAKDSLYSKTWKESATKLNYSKSSEVQVHCARQFEQKFRGAGATIKIV